MEQMSGDGKTFERESRDSSAMLGVVIIAVVVILIVLGVKAIGLLPLGWPATCGIASALGVAALLIPAFLPHRTPSA